MDIKPEAIIFSVSILTLVVVCTFFGLLPAMGWAVNKELVEMDKLPAARKAKVLRTLRRYYNMRTFFSLLAFGPPIAAMPLLVTNTTIPPIGFIIGAVSLVIGATGTAIAQFAAVRAGVGRYFDDNAIFMKNEDYRRYMNAAWRVAKRRRQARLFRK